MINLLQFEIDDVQDAVRDYRYSPTREDSNQDLLALVNRIADIIDRNRSRQSRTKMVTSPASSVTTGGPR